MTAASTIRPTVGTGNLCKSDFHVPDIHIHVYTDRRIYAYVLVCVSVHIRHICTYVIYTYTHIDAYVDVCILYVHASCLFEYMHTCIHAGMPTYGSLHGFLTLASTTAGLNPFTEVQYREPGAEPAKIPQGFAKSPCCTVGAWVPSLFLRSL